MKNAITDYTLFFQSCPTLLIAVGNLHITLEAIFALADCAF